ncbi:MAG: putative ABC transport system permease protein [Verrucomicrobia bacterium]|nr:MAG: putative ABC transport system permease protein [Verrucomicrobiota bacterium]
MIRLLHQLVLRYLARHRVIAVLDVVSVAIGVAVYVAIQSANVSATRSFRSGLDLTTGRSHLEVRGQGVPVPEQLFPEIRQFPGIEAATPVVEGYLTLPELPGSYLHVVGVDLFSSVPFASLGGQVTDVPGFDLETWLGRPGRILLHERFAADHGIKAGDSLTVEKDSRRDTLTVAGILPVRSLGQDAAPSLAVMDVGWAQEFLGTGGLTSIQIRLADPAGAADLAAKLGSRLGDQWVVEAPRTRSLQVQRMLDGFQLNLTALSMVSALVGVFLIYNTVSASVVRRRREIGILRANGASRGQVFLLFLSEGLLLGVPGVLLGLPAGVLLAQALAGSVSETISSHYVLIDVARAAVPPGHLLVATLYGLGSSLAGAWLPAREAAFLTPLAALRPHRHAQTSQGPVRTWALLGLGLLGLSAGSSWLALTTGPAWWSFAACFFLVAGFALATPFLSRWIAAWLQKLLRLLPGSVLARIAVENFERSWNRSAVTVAALMTALAMTIGVSVMVSSFRETVAAWVAQSMKADLYVTPASNEVTGFQDFLPGGFVDALSAHSAVQSVETYRQVPLSLPGKPPFLLAAVGNPGSGELRFLGGRREEKLRAWREPGAALATEPLSRRLGLSEGDKLVIPTPSGEMGVTVVGIYYDYSDDRGKLVIPAESFQQWWRGDRRFHSLAVTLHPGADAAALRKATGGEHRLAWLSNSDLRKRVFDVFDQTFAVTYILRTIAVVVAILGVSLALTILVMERTRETGILRATGASRMQVQRLYWFEAGVIGLAGSLIGICCGLGMSWILIRVVNMAFFGWTIELRIPWGEILGTPLWVVPVAVLASMYPALRASNLPVSAAVRAEL